MTERVATLEAFQDEFYFWRKRKQHDDDDRHKENQAVLNKILENQAERETKAIEADGLRMAKLNEITEKLGKIDLQTARDQGAADTRNKYLGWIGQVFLAAISGGALFGIGDAVLRLANWLWPPKH